MVLTITTYQHLTLEGLLERTKEGTGAPSLLILDSLEDPHGFGLILRTADATSVDDIIIPKHRAVRATPTATKVPTGAVEHIPVARVTNLTQSIAMLKENQFWIFGTDISGTDYRHWNTQGAIALIIGNEGHGMSQGPHKEADESLTILMTGHAQSLNADTAVDLLMYEVYRGHNPL